MEYQVKSFELKKPIPYITNQGKSSVNTIYFCEPKKSRDIKNQMRLLNALFSRIHSEKTEKTQAVLIANFGIEQLQTLQEKYKNKQDREDFILQNTKEDGVNISDLDKLDALINDMRVSEGVNNYIEQIKKFISLVCFYDDECKFNIPQHVFQEELLDNGIDEENVFFDIIREYIVFFSNYFTFLKA